MRRYLTDLDGTIIESYMSRPDKDFSVVTLLPGVAERWRRLRYETGNNLAVISNQGGVALGYQTEEDVLTKFAEVGRQLGYGWIEVHDGTKTAKERATGSTAGGVITFFVCYAEPRSPNPIYADPAQVARRKPSDAMIREAMAWEDQGEPLYIGDREEDRLAAEAAGVAFMWASEFWSAG